MKQELLKGLTPCNSCEKRQFCMPCLGLNFKMSGQVNKPYSPRCQQAAIYQTAILSMKQPTCGKITTTVQ